LILCFWFFVFGSSFLVRDFWFVIFNSLFLVLCF